MKESLSSLLIITFFFIINTRVMSQDNRVSGWLYDIKEAMGDVEIYTNPQERQYLIRPALEVWLSRAISTSIRNEWAATTIMSANQKNEIFVKLDLLEKAIEKKLPLHIPGQERFAFGTEQEKQLMRDKISDLNDCVVYKIGLQDKVWIIEKDAFGNIEGRRKWGYVWVKNKKLDVSFCYVIELYIYQKYEGGGNYGEAYGNFERSWWSGCPK